MTYIVKLIGDAEQDLIDIYEYITYTLLEPSIARNLKNRIVRELKTLKEMPWRFPLYQEEPWQSRGLRRINIGKYSGFYLIEENTIQVIRILYSGRDISTVLNDSITEDS